MAGGAVDDASYARALGAPAAGVLGDTAFHAALTYGELGGLLRIDMRIAEAAKRRQRRRGVDTSGVYAHIAGMHEDVRVVSPSGVLLDEYYVDPVLREYFHFAADAAEVLDDIQSLAADSDELLTGIARYTKARVARLTALDVGQGMRTYAVVWRLRTRRRLMRGARARAKYKRAMLAEDAELMDTLLESDTVLVESDGDAAEHMVPPAGTTVPLYLAEPRMTTEPRMTARAGRVHVEMSVLGGVGEERVSGEVGVYIV